MTNRSALLLFAVLFALLGVQIVRLNGPSPKPSNAPADEFSAARAMTTLRTILGDEAPHPIGSSAHDVVRDRVVAQFRSLGYETTIERRFACNAEPTCAMVQNIIARAPGVPLRDALVVAAHYDSAGAGPGASDDGAGVVTLIETARAIRGQHFRNPIVFLVTDGEEAGLLGAEGFVADTELAKETAAFINVEDRGTSGPSYLFETSRNNRWLVPLIARSLPRPAATSLFNSIYDLLPNDTDVTIFKRAGKAAVNFAAIGNVGYYHTPNDNLAHVNAHTLQHHGDNVLSLTRTLANVDLRQTSAGNSVYFDVLTLTMIRWPQAWSIWMAIAAFIALIVAAVMRMNAGATRARDITLGVIAFFLSFFLAALLGMLLTKLALIRGGAVSFIAQPRLLVAAMWLTGIGSAIAMSSWLRRRAGFDGLFLGIALSWTIVAIVVNAFLSGGAYLFLVPAVAMAILALLRASEATSAIVCAAIAAVLFFPLGLALYDALGTMILPGIAAILAIVATTFAPAFAAAPMRRVIVIAMFGIAAILALVTITLPVYSRDSPRFIPIAYFSDADAKTNEWVVGSLAGSMRDVGHFGATRISRYPWFRSQPSFFVGNAPDARIVAPEIA
ncbi:MAG TPA: M28 family peptidase, partial [Thermoanaerobaculia bacterium]|nr:M28 family peptidase [Thermoanaerobaculia bacterium]